MRCERSQKNQLLTVWGLRASSAGMPIEEIKATMKKMGRKTVAKIRDFVKSDRR